MKNLKGKVAIVTGAASKRGMGHAIALKLADEGADVVITDKLMAPRSLFPGDEGWGGLDAEVAEIKALGREGLAIMADISKSSEIDIIMGKTLKKFGKVDILVHCAAIRGPVGKPAVELSESEWRAILDINTTGAFLISKAVARSMIEKGQGGRIVLIASQAGTHGVPGSAAYCVSKYGVIGLVKTLAIELGPHKINVNAINPGAIITNLRDESFEKMSQVQGISWDEARKKDYARISANIPLGRLGTPEEVADLAYFLVSDLSTYLTGETIGVTGGFI
ncbi:MAG: SDR family NAD(P)-dependent oxidoreductase [Dehalococcoidales bacterium]|jgi:meso-butanediol dehydrogenase/(S,S)-butanediol dehydrogenase/diacetyl reductase